jgi:hypothetical protein|tara:strand:+ start:1335 stop:2225 length:891 start_codon:yes stop_codon:yes gene_type:complete
MKSTKVTNDNLEFDKYLNAPNWKNCISSTLLKQISNTTVAHAIGQRPKKSVAFDIGTAIHYILLEPEKFEQNVKRCGKDRKTKEYRQLKNEFPDDIILPDQTYEDCIRARDAVYNKTESAKILTSPFGKNEVSVKCDLIDLLGQDTSFHGKARVDRVIEGETSDILIDIKTTRDASQRSMIRDIANMGYHIQEAWYRYCWERTSGKKVSRFLFMCVEKEPPFASCIYELPEHFVAEGRERMLNALHDYNESITEGVILDYPDKIIQLDETDIPLWYYKVLNPEEELISFKDETINL